jgi:hypothetical protein
MKIIKEYILIEGYLSDVEKKVMEKIKEGWQPFGNLQQATSNPSGGGIELVQPMVKYEEKEVVERPDDFEKISIKIKKEPPKIAVEYLSLSDYLLDLIKTEGGSPNIKVTEAQKNKWANEFRLMVDQDGFEVDWIHATLKKVFEAPGSGSFAWKNVIRSAGKFREHIKAGKLDHLFAEKKTKGNVGEW